MTVKMGWLFKSSLRVRRGEYFLLALEKCWSTGIRLDPPPPEIHTFCRKTVGLGVYYRDSCYPAQGPHASIPAGSVISDGWIWTCVCGGVKLHLLLDGTEQAPQA